MRVCIDPGHGGKDPGALGKPGPLNEADVVLQVAGRLHRVLQDRGHSSFLTRDADFYVDTYPRSVLSNNTGTDLFISLHCNASGVGGHGIEAYYAPNKGAPDYGLTLAVYNAAIQAFSDHQARGVKEDTTTRHERLGVLRDTEAPAVLIELEFIDVAAQYAFITDPAQQQRYAALADGLERATSTDVPSLPVAGTPPARTAVPARPSVIGRQSERALQWNYRAAGATHYRTRYREDAAPFSLWSDWGTDLSFALTAGENTAAVTFQVQAQNVNGASPLTGEDTQTLVSPSPPPTITHSIAYRSEGPLVLFGLPSRAAAFRYRTRLDPLAPWSAWSDFSAQHTIPYDQAARGNTVYFEAQARSASGLVSATSAVEVEIPLRPQPTVALAGAPQVFFNGTELANVQRVSSTAGIGVYGDAVQIVILGRSQPPDPPALPTDDLRVVWPDGGETRWPLLNYRGHIEPPALRLTGRQRAHAAQIGKVVRQYLAEAQFDNAVLAGSTRHSAAVSHYTLASGRTLADDLKEALADQHRDLDVGRVLEAYGLLLLDRLGNIASMESASEHYTLPATYEPGLVVAWRAATETHPAHMGSKQITAIFTPTTPTGQALTLAPQTLTDGGLLPAIEIEGQWRNDTHAALHIALERIRLLYNSGTLRATITGTSFPEPRQRLVDLPASVVADWPYWALRQVEQQWGRETGWQTTLLAHPVPDGPRVD